jgi:hypothetical protein
MTASPRLLSDLRGRRYGEVLLVFLDPAARIEVYNSFTLNDCPQDLWDRLDVSRIADENGAAQALLNGPRYWLMDGIGKIENVEPVVVDFGGIAMRRVASIELDGPMAQTFYCERRVNRGAAWYFNAGTKVHELVSPDGTIYVMQAYCVGIDPTLDQSSLDMLGAHLALPDGWRFRTRVLADELVVDTTQHVATVVQDELHNTYTLTT